MQRLTDAAKEESYKPSDFFKKQRNVLGNSASSSKKVGGGTHRKTKGSDLSHRRTQNRGPEGGRRGGDKGLPRPMKKKG